MNCWEFKKCGREVSGHNVDSLGVCPASTDDTHHGKNGGTNAGRFCWRVAGTLCGGVMQGSYASKKSNCLLCDFYKLVKQEQGAEELIRL